jgi:peptide/nickel transport system substrate-binding protein
MPRLLPVLALGAAISLAGCSGGQGQAATKKYADNGTLTIAIDSDPGSLDPQRSVNGVNLLMSVFAYDTPVKLLDSGDIAPSVVSSWAAHGTSAYSLTIAKGVTCADGSPMDATVVADNINYVADPDKGSGMNGVAVPAGAVATADQARGVVEVKLTSGAPFFLQNLAELPLVCGSGLKGRDALKDKSSGSGPFVLDKVVPGSSYEFSVRDGYNWGPKGASTAEPGTPKKVVFKVVKSTATIANLLLSKQVNAAYLAGPDTTRLKNAKLFSDGGSIIGLELTFNQAPGEPTADVAVRRALIGALDLGETAKVSTGGLGGPANGLLTDPKICAGDTLGPNKPAFDADAAAKALDAAGWTAGAGGVRAKDGKPLKLSFVYDNEDSENSATAEYIRSAWTKLGVQVELNGQSFDQKSDVVFGGKGKWTATLIGLGVSNPATLVPFFSGPTPAAGVNYATMHNSAYESAIKAAQAKPGVDGCSDWNAAESALIKDSDITPLSVEPYTFWGNGAEFNVEARVLEPTSLRVLG